MAARQVAMAGSAEQVEHAAAIMEETRKRLYQLLIELTPPRAGGRHGDAAPTPVGSPGRLSAEVSISAT